MYYEGEGTVGEEGIVLSNTSLDGRSKGRIPCGSRTKGATLISRGGEGLRSPSAFGASFEDEDDDKSARSLDLLDLLDFPLILPRSLPSAFCRSLGLWG